MSRPEGALATYFGGHFKVIKWKHFQRYWPFVLGIHLSPVNSPQKCQWCGALMFSLICAWINGWVNNREAGDLRCHHAHYDVIVMIFFGVGMGVGGWGGGGGCLLSQTSLIVTVEVNIPLFIELWITGLLHWNTVAFVSMFAHGIHFINYFLEKSLAIPLFSPWGPWGVDK